MSYQKIKHERLICIQTNINIETETCLGMIRVLTSSYKVDVSEVLKVCL